MDKPKRVIKAMIGASGSGKSTYAEKLAKETGFPLVSTDAVRKLLTGDENSQSANSLVFAMIPLHLGRALTEVGGVIYDATNYNGRNREVVLDVAERFGAEIEWYVMKTPIDECVRRQSLRERRVPVSVIEKQFYGQSIPKVGKIIYV